MPSVLAAINEMGGGSASTYFAQMAEMTTRNADAARDYYPPLEGAVVAEGAKIKAQDRWFLERRKEFGRRGMNAHFVTEGETGEDGRFHLEGLPFDIRWDDVAVERRRVERVRMLERSGIRRGYGRGLEGEEDDEDDEDEEGEKVVKTVVEDEDEMEQDADYQMGERVDDDDGYISQDSGHNVATF